MTEVKHHGKLETSSNLKLATASSQLDKPVMLNMLKLAKISWLKLPGFSSSEVESLN